MAGFLPHSAVVENLDEVSIETGGFAYFGSSQQAKLGWVSADANANELVLSLPTGGATDVPVFVVGMGIEATDLGWFDGVTQTHFAVADADDDSYVALAFSADDVVAIYAKHAAGGSKQDRIAFTSTETVLNEGQNDLNVRVESDNNANFVVFDAGLDAIAIGGAVQGYRRLHIQGAFTSDGVATEAQMQTYSGRLTGASGDTTRLLGSHFQNTITTQAVAETVADVGQVMFDEPGIVVGAGSSITTAFTVLISAAPTEGGTNYGLWVNTTEAITAGIALVGAASTNNQILLVQNTSNAAAASHAIMDVAVGGTTSTGDPQYRLTVPGGTSFYMGVDNSSVDEFIIGIGTAVGTTPAVVIDPRTGSIASATRFTVSGVDGFLDVSGGGDFYSIFGVGASSIAVSDTGITSLWKYVDIGALTITRPSGVQVDKATTIGLQAPIEGGALTLIDASAIRILNTTGTPVNQHGIIIEAMTAGATLNSGILTFSGIMIGAAATANMFDDATSGAASTAMFIGNASINVTSDVRVKENIVTYTGDALALFRQVNVVEFDYLDSHRPFGGVYEGRYVGLTAQNLYSAAPWTVNTQGGRDCWECRAGLRCEYHLPWTVKGELLDGLVVRAFHQVDDRLGKVELWQEEQSAHWTDHETRIHNLEEENDRLRREVADLRRA